MKVTDMLADILKFLFHVQTSSTNGASCPIEK